MIISLKRAIKKGGWVNHRKWGAAKESERVGGEVSLFEPTKGAC